MNHLINSVLKKLGVSLENRVSRALNISKGVERDFSVVMMDATNGFFCILLS